jgi:two-component system, LytTR family, sensor kinase
MTDATALTLAIVLSATTLVLGLIAVLTRRVVSTPAERTVHAALHTASLAARPLRKGLDPDSALDAAPHLRALTGSDGLTLYGPDAEFLAADPPGGEIWTPTTRAECLRIARESIDGGRRVLRREHSPVVVGQPLLDDDGTVLGALVAVNHAEPAPGMLGAIGEVARYAASQLQLAELDASRARLDRAEVLALRAQISPHFIYNALTTIASFVRTDPDRARELILEFADFTRYSFRSAGPYTVLADELRNIDRYLVLERARFGPNLSVTLRIAPEVLTVVVPFLALQPLVENAVRHGLAGRQSGSVEIVAHDEGSDCIITIEDDGVGMDPDALRSGSGDVLSDGEQSAHVGLTNVDHRLRAAFGNDYGLVVETAPGAGTKVIMRVPKFRSGVRA